MLWSRDQPIEFGIFTGVINEERVKSELKRNTVPKYELASHSDRVRLPGGMLGV